MTLRYLTGAFFALFTVVVYAQNKEQAPAKSSSAPVVANFPSREQATQEWRKKEPAPEESKTARGPATYDTGPNAPSGNTIKATPLASPKIDYPKEALARVAPMDDKEISKFADEVYKRSLAMSAVPGGEYKTRGMRMIRATMQPGAVPETVSLALGMGTIVSFVDRTGAPLVVDAIEGFSSAFNVRVMKTERAEKEGSNLFSIDPRMLTGQGNVAVQLSGVLTPFTFNVDVGKASVVDSHVQFVLPVVSEKRQVLPGDRMESDGGVYVPEMQGFLAGIPPVDAVEVTVKNVPGTYAWMWNKKLYVKTQHTIFTPAFFRRMGSGDGTAIYELPLTPVVRMGVEGREMQALLDFPFIPSQASVQRK